MAPNPRKAVNHVMRHMAFIIAVVGCRRARLRRDFAGSTFMVRDDFLVHRMVNAGLFEIGCIETASSIAVKSSAIAETIHHAPWLRLRGPGPHCDYASGTFLYDKGLVQFA